MLIWNIHKHPNIETTTKMLLYTLGLSQWDYVNSILCKAPTMPMKPYQTPQKLIARLAYKKAKREDAYIGLWELHWLPIKCRTIFKVLTIAYNNLHG